MTNYLKFDIVCKYDKKSETYYGGIPSLGIELKYKHSQGDLLEDAIMAVRNLFNGITRCTNGGFIEFESSLAAIKLEIIMKVTKDQRLDEFTSDDEHGTTREYDLVPRDKSLDNGTENCEGCPDYDGDEICEGFSTKTDHGKFVIPVPISSITQCDNANHGQGFDEEAEQ